MSAAVLQSSCENDRKTVRSAGIRCRRNADMMAPSAQRPHPPSDGLPDLVRRIFLDEMDSRDRHLGLRWEAAGQGPNPAVGGDPPRLRLPPQLGPTAPPQP